METIVGIDLGTTNCSVTAINEEGKTKSIKNKRKLEEENRRLREELAKK